MTQLVNVSQQDLLAIRQVFWASERLSQRLKRPNVTVPGDTIEGIIELDDHLKEAWKVIQRYSESLMVKELPPAQSK